MAPTANEAGPGSEERASLGDGLRAGLGSAVQQPDPPELPQV